MAGFDDMVKEIDVRIAQMREELERLETARGALVGVGASSGGARRVRQAASPDSAPATPRRRPGRPRGKRGSNTRSKEALKLVRARPGITIPEIASELKILPNYLYRVMPKLVEEGQVKRDGQGWHPVG